MVDVVMIVGVIFGLQFWCIVFFFDVESYYI